jgi:hypothetical protein
MNVYKTKKGTELPLLMLKNKEYLEVKYRLVWFREEHPDWSIETEFLSVTEQNAYAKATIKDESGRIISTSHKFESLRGFPDFMEKAETGAIGRALALIGYGTQFCADELDEGKRIVDSPVVVPQSKVQIVQNQIASKPQPVALPEPFEPGEVFIAPAEAKFVLKQNLGDFVCEIGRKYRGKKLNQIKRNDLSSYVNWLKTQPQKSGNALHGEVAFFVQMAEAYLAEQGE